jgi:hypothetical protein
MSNQEILDRLITSVIPEVKALAVNYKTLQDQFANNEISRDEFNELTDDILDLQKIEQNMSNFNILIILKKVIIILKQIKAGLPV